MTNESRASTTLHCTKHANASRGLACDLCLSDALKRIAELEASADVDFAAQLSQRNSELAARIAELEAAIRELLRDEAGISIERSDQLTKLIERREGGDDEY